MTFVYMKHSWPLCALIHTLRGEKKGYYSEMVLSFCAFSMYLSPGYSEL